MSFDLKLIELDNIDKPDETDNDVVRGNLSEAVKIDPVVHAEEKRVTEETGLQPAAVDESVRQKFELDNIDVDNLSSTSPRTAQFMTDFDNSIIAREDIEPMKMLESIFDFRKTFQNIGESISVGLESGAAGIQGAGVDMTADRIQDLVPMGTLPIGMEMDALEMSRTIAGQFGIESDADLNQVKKQAIDQMLANLREIHEKQAKLTPDDLNTLEQGVRAGIESLGHMAPGFLLMLLSGGRATPLLATMGVQTFGASYGDARAEGLTPEQSAWFGLIDAGIEVGTELLPTKTLERIITGESKGLTKSALKFMIQEMGTEQLATLGQSLNSFAFGLDEEMEKAASVSEMVDIQLQRQAVTAIATVVAGGAQATAATGVRKLIDAVTTDDQQKETRGEVEQRALDQINAEAQKVKMREHSQETFKQFIETADGDNNTHVFIDQVQTALYLQSKTNEEVEADPALTMLFEQSKEQSETGEDVQIPIADFATTVAGTEHFDNLRDSMTLSEDTVSPFRQEQVQKDTENYVQNLIEEADQNASEYVEAQEIYDNVREQLIDSGQVNAQNASIMAQVVPAWATAQAARQGVSVKEVYENSGLIIEGPQTGERARLEGELFEQDNPAFKDAPIIFETVRDNFLNKLPEDAEIEEVMGMIDTFSPEEKNFIKALEKDDWLGFDFPSQAINAALTDELDNFDPSPGLKQSIGRMVNKGVTRERFAQAPIQVEIPSQVDEASALDQTMQQAQEGSFNNNRQLKVQIQANVLEAAEAEGIDLSQDTPEVEEYLTRVGIRDAFFSLESNINAVGWYDLTVSKALNIISLVHPEIATDEKAKFAFSWALAVTSNGMKVDKNFRLAEDAYSKYKETGEMPSDIGVGNAGPAINKSLKLFNTLVDKLGIDTLTKFMSSEFTVGQLNRMGVEGIEVTGENAGTVVRGASILGPKIGNGFFSNLNGFFDQLTMDRWLMRTWGRWTGTLIEERPEMVKLKKKELRDLVKEMKKDKDATRDFEQALGARLQVSRIEELAQQIQKASIKPETRKLFNKTSVGQSLRKSGNALVKYLDGQKEAPTNGTERNRIRKVFSNILEGVRSEGFGSLTMSDLQALLWYPERRLYDMAKSREDVAAGYENDEAPDYANAASNLAKEMGVSEEDIVEIVNKTEEEHETRISTGSTRSEDGDSGVTGEQRESGRSEGFDGRERAEFLKRNVFITARLSRADNAKSRSYSKPSTGTLGGVRGLIHKPNRVFSNILDASELPPVILVEMESSAENAARFHSAIQSSKSSSKFGAAVFVYSAEEYQGFKLFQTEDGKSGFAIKPDGDIVSVFSDGGGKVHSMLSLAVEQGGTKLDAFDTVLPGIYSTNGFKEVARDEWNDEFTPEGWDKNIFDEFNGGEPAVVYMEYDANYSPFQETEAPFEQRKDQDKEARGFYDPANSIIRLQESSDLSTFLHEFAHFMYEMEVNGDTELLQSINNWYKRNAVDVAKEANTYLGDEFDSLKQGRKTKPMAVRVDKRVLAERRVNKLFDGVIERERRVTPERRNMAVKKKPESLEQNEPPEGKEGSITPEHITQFLDEGTTGDQDIDAAIRRAVHEQFARGFETYLMEGKSPSIELRNAFRAFARWLARVYQTLRGSLNVKLDEEMRQVFDRLLATEEQIQASEARARVEPLFTDAAMAGMTDEKFADYQAQQEKTKEVSSESLRNKIIKQLTRQTKAWWKEEKQDLIDEEIQRLSEEPVYAARTRLRDGDIKLDHATVKEMIGEEQTNKLGHKSTVISPKLRGMTAKAKEGIHPDEAAALLGYRSGSELLVDLVNVPDIKVAATTNAQARMIENHGDILTDGTIEREADEAVHNEERGKLILLELKSIAKGLSVPTTDRATIKAVAEERIGRLSFRQIHPGKYRRAEIRAAQEAARMLAAGNKEGAAAAKLSQVTNFYLGMAATNARNETMKIVDRMARYRKKKVREEIQKAEGGYWDQLSRILNRFEFRKSASLKEIESLNLWMKERMENDGDGLVLSNTVLNESYVTHWKNVPFTDLQGISDSIKNIEHVARYANKITRMQEEVDFNKLVDRWVTSMNDKVKSRFKSTRTTVIEGRNWGRWFMAQMTKIPYLASWLDGGERAGLSHQILVQPMTDAYNEELKLWDVAGKPVMEAILNRDKADVKRHNRKIYIPEIDDHLFGHQIIAVALNTGNRSNLKKLLLGEGWADPEVDGDIAFENPKLQAVLSHMTKEDWQMVQLIWDQMELLYPQLAEVHRKTTGLTPPKIESSPFTIDIQRPGGGLPERIEMKGGYYPVKYDPNRDQRAQENEDKLNAETDSMFSNNASIQASVNASATNERTKYYAPIRLSMDVVSAHFQETIHYITHHDAVREINRLTRNKRVAEVIKEKLGPEEYAQLKPWLNDIAKDGREAPSKMFWDDILQRLRFGVTLGVMGFKASTGIIQLSGLSNTMAELGVAPVLKSIKMILGSKTTMKDAWNFASENSKVLSHRVQTMDREIKNAMKRIEGNKGIKAAVQEAAMKHIALIQTYMVDLPSWHAAYAKGMADWGDEARAFSYADWVIENVQGSGVTKDMARIMRGQAETGRMFTMFMTFFSSLWNMERDLVKGARSGLYSTSSVAAKAMFLFTIPVLFDMIMRGQLGEPDLGEDDDRLQSILMNTALFPIQSVPFVRDLANATISDFGYNISPLQQILEQGTQTIPEVVTRGFTDEEITLGQVKGATKFIGAALGVPGTNQAWLTGEHLYDVMVDGEDFTTHQLLFGPERK